MSTADARVAEASAVLAALGFPTQQSNKRSALALLALLGLEPETKWSDASSALIGIAEIMTFANERYGTEYRTGSRETFRKHSLHQFVAAGIVDYNPDNPTRPVNSPDACYQIDAETLELLKLYGTLQWAKALAKFSAKRKSLVAQYARHREMTQTPVTLVNGAQISLSPGSHSDLIRKVITDFAPRFAPGARLLYIGDTADKWAHFDQQAFVDLGITVDPHGKMPDVILYFPQKNWLLLIEAVTSVGPMNSKRHAELSAIFAAASAGLVFVTAFLDRTTLARHLSDIAWETEVWVAEQPSHMIHFNGSRFLGPY